MDVPMDNTGAWRITTYSQSQPKSMTNGTCDYQVNHFTIIHEELTIFSFDFWRERQHVELFKNDMLLTIEIERQ